MPRSAKKKFIITVHARVILLIANPSSRRRLHAIENMVKCIFGNKLENKTFQLFTYVYCFGICKISFGRDLGTKYVVTTAFQSAPTTKKCVNFFCVRVPMLTKEEYND